MTTKEVLERYKGRLTRDQLYSWERNGWLRPSKRQRGLNQMYGRDYSEADLSKIDQMLELKGEGVSVRAAHQRAQDRLNTAGKQNPRSILIVEDDPVHRFILEHEFRSSYHLEFASDEAKALSYLNSDQLGEFDVMVLDLRLPEAAGADGTSIDCGLHILRELQAVTSRKPMVYVMSGSLFNSTRTEVKKLGAKDIVEKPFSPPEFRLLIERQLKREPKA